MKRMLVLFVFLVVLCALFALLFFMWAFGEFRDAAPVVVDEFYFHETGVVKEYEVTARFRDWLAGANGYWELTTYLEDTSGLSQEKVVLQPTLKVSTFLNGKELESLIVSDRVEVVVDARYSKKTLFTKLRTILWRGKKEIYTVRVEVLQGDTALAPYADRFKTRIAIDAYP